MRTSRSVFLLLLFLLLVASFRETYAAESSDYALPNPILTSGSGVATNSSYEVFSITGQAAVAVFATSASYQLIPGSVEAVGASEGEGEGTLEGEGEGASEGEGEGIPEGEGEGAQNPVPEFHHGDFDGGADNLINLTELLRFIQFYNSDGYHCAQVEDTSEDGYMPGSGEQASCDPHIGDFKDGADWRIDLSELLRFIQFYNSGGYHRCDDPLSDEGYCPGPPPAP